MCCLCGRPDNWAARRRHYGPILMLAPRAYAFGTRFPGARRGPGGGPQSGHGTGSRRTARTKKKPGLMGPRSNNDKRRMVTRRTNRTRTVNKDSGRAEEFEKFSFALDEPFSPAFSGGENACSQGFAAFPAAQSLRPSRPRPPRRPSFSVVAALITADAPDPAAPLRADRSRRGDWPRGPLRCCCPRSAGSRPCPLPTDVAARRLARRGSSSRSPRG